MDASGESLSDSELRQKLMELGVKVGPITDTTRKLYTKKYKELTSRKKKRPLNVRKLENGRSSHLGFSSDDGESETENLKMELSRRRKSGTTAAAGKSAHVNSDRSIRSPELSFNESGFKKPVPRNRRSTRISVNSSAAFNGYDISRQTSTRRSIHNSDSSVNNTTYDMEVSDSDVEPLDQHTMSKTRRRGQSIQSPARSVDNNMWSDAEDLAAKLSSSHDSHHPETNHLHPRTSTPTKGVVNTSSNHPNHSSSLVYSSLSNPNSFKGNSSFNHKSFSGVNGHRFKSPDISGEFATEDSSTLAQSNCPQKISSFLLLGAVIFFVAIGLVYVVGMKKWNLVDILNTQESTKNISVFNISEIHGVCETPECVRPTNAKHAIQCCHKLFEKLSLQAGKYDCDEKSDISSRNITKREALEFVKSLNMKTGRTELSLLNDALLLFIKNEKWGVRLTSKDNNDKVIFPEEAWWLESHYPFKTLKCRLFQASHYVLIRGVVGVFVLFIGYAIYMFCFLYQKNKKKYKKSVCALAEEIIGILKSYHAECRNSDAEPFIPIPHVRDMIIPLADRERLAHLWEDACKMIEDNESRIRVEYQQVAGEDNKVWRWLESTAPESSRKVWQGRAFENDVSGLNALSYSATPCLKIRNMFTPEKEMQDGWKTSVIDAVMEKCGDQHEIVHIAIANDSSVPEGCVYVKFRNREAAGRAYKNLHGCWFDGKLVTVKFLRLERYYEHYPEAQSLDIPLKPSNNLKLSLSHKELFLSSEVLERS